MAPSTNHRLRFREYDTEKMLLWFVLPLIQWCGVER